MPKILQPEKRPHKGLLPIEIAVLAYLVFTLVVMFFMRGELHNPVGMLLFRLRVVAVMAVMWGLYRLVPCPLVMLIRVLAQIVLLGDWYPDTYEFNRCFLNLDHVFCGLEQTVFSCQPSLWFSRVMPWRVVSELLDLGYVSYYPIFFFTVIFYFLYRRPLFQRAAFVVLSSFLLLYVVFIFLPVAGPTFYFRAVGTDVIEQGVFPSLGTYFAAHSDLSYDCLPTPGWQDGLMWKLVEVAKWVGERPTAAFPSSHIGVTVVCLLLLRRTGNRRVFLTVLPFAVLMFFATVYIQAHYAIDALAGLASGTILYIVLWRVSRCFRY
ncbi:MAG: phosphatase PAP2 family protein [Prevotella sp.]|nr:phosphatase PAP2 family protein [Prevotella sp.]